MLVVRPQDQQHPGPPEAQALRAAQAHAVQRGGDGAHLLFPEQQLQQPGEFFPGEAHIPHQGVHFLQAFREGAPKAHAGSGGGGVAPGLQGFGPAAGFLPRAGLRQEIGEGLQRFRCAPALPQGVRQPAEGDGHSAAQPVQPRQGLPVGGGSVPVALRAQVPCFLLPPDALPPQVPGEAIILQLVRLFAVQGTEAGAQAAHQVSPPPALGDGAQGFQHIEGQAAGGEGLGLLHIDGQLIGPEYGSQDALLFPEGGHGHGDIRMPQAPVGHHQLPDAGGRPAAFPGKGIHAAYFHAAVLRREGRRVVPVQVFRQIADGVGLRRGQALHPELRAQAAGHIRQAAEGALRHGETLLLPLAQGQGHGQVRAPAKDALQHRQLPGGEIGEAVGPDAAGPHGAAGDPVGQAGGGIPAVPQLADLHGLPGFHHHGHVRQLLPHGAGGFFRGGAQVVGRGHGALQLLRRGHEAAQEIRPAAPVPETAEAGPHVLQGQGHEQQPPALVRQGVRQPAQLHGGPVIHPGKAEHLAAEAQPGAADGGQAPFRPVGLLFRRQQHHVGHAVHPRPDLLADAPGLPASRLAQQQLQHIPAPFRADIF